MVQLRLYLKELKDFLNTVTIKDTMIADSMLTTWVKDEWQEIVAYNPLANPYYRSLMGDYILFSYPDQLRQVIADLYEDGRLFNEKAEQKYAGMPTDKVVDFVLKTLFPLKTRVRIDAPTSVNINDEGDRVSYFYRDVPNKSLYRYCNEIPIISSYDDTYRIPFAREFLYETQLGKAIGLRVHSSTSVVYRIPNERYNTLTSRYPKTASIIHSIVYPIPIDVADTSSIQRDILNKRKMKKIDDTEELAPLVYDPKLLEQQERQSLIDCMTNTLSMISKRYQIREFGYENLYAPAHYYIIWQTLYLALFVQRIMNIHTGDAHLYHIWNYLKSNGFEDYRDVLTLRQQKFLYKNLPYLIKNKGTQHAFEILNYVFFHSQNIDLSGKNTLQTTREGEITTADTTKKYPAIRSIKIGKSIIDGINENFDRHSRFEDILHYVGEHAGESVFNDQEEYHYGVVESLPELYDKEREAKLEYQDQSLFTRSTTRHTKLLTYSPISHRNTKILELKNNNTVDYIRALYTKFIGETLLYRLSRGDLDFVVEIQLPESSKRIELPINEWVGLIFYALHKADNTKCDYPPDKIYVSWPYNQDLLLDTEYDPETDEVSADEIYALPDTFYWMEQSCSTHLHLASLVSCYEFKGMKFELSDNRQDVHSFDRFWTDGNQNVLRYNYNTKRWNIVDKDENIIYRSANVYNDSVNLADVGWYDKNGTIADRVTAIESTYFADFHMPLYKGKIRSVEELAEVLHEQAIGFIIMNLDVNSDESAVNRAAYNMIMNHRCVGVNTEYLETQWIDREGKIHTGPKECGYMIDVDFFGYNKNGKKRSYTEYLQQKTSMIDNLKLVFERYDIESDPSVMYYRMTDEIIHSLLPEDSPYAPMSAKSATYRYKKIINLFKSMTAYNLAYIDIQYQDVDSTKLSIDVSDYYGYRINNWITDNMSNSDFEFKTSTVIKSTIPLTYMDQMQVISFNDVYDDDPDVDTEIKLTICDKIDKIIEIYNTKRLSKARKKSQLTELLGEDIADIVDSLPYVQLQNIQNAVHVVRESHISEDIKDTKLFDEEHITVPDNEITDTTYNKITITDAEVVTQ